LKQHKPPRLRQHKFTLLGYEQGRREQGQILRLCEATVVIDAKEAKALGEFFLRCAVGLRNEPEWEHEHFNIAGEPDIVVFNKNKASKRQ